MGFSKTVFMILKAGFFFFFCLNFSAHILLILKLRVDPPGSVAKKKELNRLKTVSN